MITPDDPIIEYPSGWSLALMLPHDLFDAILADVIHDPAGNGKSHLVNIFDAAINNDGIGVLRACRLVFYAIATHPEAEKWYRENIWLEDNTWKLEYDASELTDEDD